MPVRIALASLPFAGTYEAARGFVEEALDEAATRGARILCTPENYLPGLRGVGFPVETFNNRELDLTLDAIAAHVRKTAVALVLGCELLQPIGLLQTALVFDQDGSRIGRQDKVQIDPSEEGTYVSGAGRAIFTVAGLTFGICICHEGFRYPETVRWAARRGAQLVFHPHFGLPTTWGRPPMHWAESRNSLHEKAAMCRAAENNVFFATVNYALPASQTTSAVIDPHGRKLAHQPYAEAGVLVVDIRPEMATRELAIRFRPEDHVI